MREGFGGQGRDILREPARSTVERLGEMSPHDDVALRTKSLFSKRASFNLPPSMLPRCIRPTPALSRAVRARTTRCLSTHMLVAPSQQEPGPTEKELDQEATLKFMTTLAHKANDPKIFAEVVEYRRMMHGDRHPNTLHAISNLAQMLQDHGNYDAAEAAAQEAHESWRAMLGLYHADSLVATSNYAQILTARGMRLRHAPEKPTVPLHTIHSASNPSLDPLATPGKYDEAEPLAREAVEVAHEVLGAQERDTLVALSNLAQTLAAQGKHDEAEPIMREDLKSSISLLGAQHADTLVAYSNLAQLLAMHGKYEDACELFRAELEGSRATHGHDHPLTLACSSRLVESLLANNELASAEPLMRENLAATRKVLGHAHPDGGVAVRNLAKLLQARGKLEDAEALAREELDLCVPYGTEHARTREATSLLASMLRAQGKRSAALPLLRELHGDHHPRTMQAISAAVGQVCDLSHRPGTKGAPLLPTCCCSPCPSFLSTSSLTVSVSSRRLLIA